MGYFGHRYWLTQSIEQANAFTGAGAVLAACISAMVAFRSISIAEEAQKPYPYPFFDTQSRYGLVLLKLKNAGGSAAHQVFLEWEGGIPELRVLNGVESSEPIVFATDEKHAVSVLMPGEETATILGSSHTVARRVSALKSQLKGQVVYRDIRGTQHRQPFFIDTSFFQWALKDETELLKAQYAVTLLPETLSKMTRTLEQISTSLDIVRCEPQQRETSEHS